MLIHSSRKVTGSTLELSVKSNQVERVRSFTSLLPFTYLWIWLSGLLQRPAKTRKQQADLMQTGRLLWMSLTSLGGGSPDVLV